MPREFRRYFFLTISILFAALYSFHAVVQVSAQTATPLPTPRRPAFATPPWIPVNPTLYPCRTTDAEFHPLRPYPANACDPLIPRKTPEAIDDIPDKLYLTFSCNKAAVPQGLYDVKDVVYICDMDVLPSRENWINIPLTRERDPVYGPTRSVNYRCEADSYDICFVKLIHADVILTYSDTQFPIIGNVQNYLTDTQKVNNYLSWYLSGTVNQSEHEPLDMDTAEDIARLINYSGPVKKLLAYDSQETIQRTLRRSPPLGSDYHNYIVDPGRVSNSNPFHPNIPLSSLEDITGEITVAIEPARQPTMPEIDGYIFQIGLGIGTADSRLYFPHLRETNVLTQFLTSTYRPYPRFITPTVTPLPNPIYTYADDSSLIGQRITYHQGPYPPVPGGTGDPPIVEVQYINGSVVRNTEVIEGAAAPPPLMEAADIYCDLSPVRSNQGDDLVGRSISTLLVYRQLFRYTPQLVIDCPCPASNTTTQCISYGVGEQCFALEGDECNQTTRRCCWGSCPPVPPAECFNNYSVLGYCDYITCTNDSCNAPCCEWEIPPPPVCPDWPEKSLKSKAIISTFSKTPMVDRLYELLVNSPQSLINRFMPGKSQNGDMTVVPPPNREPESAIPGTSTARYWGDTNDLHDFRVEGGRSGGGAVYFPRIGSIMDYILGAGGRRQNKNLQCLFWPYGRCRPIKLTALCNGEKFAQIIENPAPASAHGQSLFEAQVVPRLTQEHIDAFSAAEQETGIPCEVFIGIHYTEANLELNRGLAGGHFLGDVTLTESAINAGRLLNTFACGQQDNCENLSFERLVYAVTHYNGGFNRNCQASTNCAIPAGFPTICGPTVSCSPSSTDDCLCVSNQPNSCLSTCNFSFLDAFGVYPYPFTYSGQCPPPYEGYDDPYVFNFWQSPDHDVMYRLMTYSCTPTLPVVHQRMGVMTVAISMYLSETSLR